MIRALLKQHRGSIVFVLLLLTVRGAIADWSPVPTGSMKPTILEGDVLLIDRLAYDLKLPFSRINLAKLGEPARGDIVVFRLAGAENRLVKRLIGLPGDRVALRGNRLVINGKTLDYSPISQQRKTHFPYLSARDSVEQLSAEKPHWVRKLSVNGRRGFDTVTVPAGQYLMLGDNRDNSGDSRVFGFVPRAALIGRSQTILASFDMQNHLLPRWSRWGLKLDSLSR